MPFSEANPDDLEALEQTVDILWDHDLVDLRQSRQEAAAGKTLPLERD